MRIFIALFATLIFLLKSIFIIADNIDVTTALKLATNFYNERALNAGEKSGDRQNLELSYAKYLGNDVMYFVFSTDKGFIIISADDDAYPVLAYSFDDTYETENVSPEFSAWMSAYEHQIQSIKNKGLQANNTIYETWQKYLASDFIPHLQKSGTKSVEPLLLSTWDQGRYYNYLCPEDPAGQGGHVWSGCVATAMAQVMYYYRYPSQGTGTHGYYSEYGYLSANFGNTQYNWNGMQNEISGKFNFDMAQLQLHCGIAIDMHYSPGGSGAYMDDDANAMKNYFGYSSTTQLFYRNNYNDNDWANLLISNLDNKMPIQYAGYGESGGHAFVCDGYQGTDYFHFNWGWSGHNDGYFYLNNLNPGYTFNNGQQAILNSYPAVNFPQNCTSLTTITSSYGSIEDGTSPKYNYQDNLDCRWLIDPTDVIDYIRINFERFETESVNDVVTIYDGESTSDPVLGSFSGNTIPPEIISNAKKVLVRFTSNASLNANGWFLTFNSKPTSFCSTLTELNTPNGIISDGSNNFTYNSNSNCKWRINLPEISVVNIQFTSFNLASDNDFIKIYDEAANIEVANLTNNSPPQTLSFVTNKVLIFFKTTPTDNADGWELNYTSTPLGISENAGNYLIISPNPATDYLKIESSFDNITELSLDIYNSTGKCILTKILNADGGLLLDKIDISQLAQGIYFLKLGAENFRQTQRFIKQ